MTRALAIVALTLLGCRPQSAAPCTAAPLALDFNEVQARPGVVHERFVKVTNPSSVDRLVSARPLEFPFAAPELPVLVYARSEAQVSVRFVAVDALLHLDELVLTSDDGSCDFNVPLRALGSGAIRVSPDALEFSLGAGQVKTKELLIENTRREPAQLELVWSSGMPASSVTSVVVPARSSITVPVTAAPRDWKRVSAELRFIGRGLEASVRVTIGPSSPRLEITPSTLDLPRVGVDPSSQPPAFAERVVRIRNAATSGLPNAPPLRLLPNDPFFGVPGEFQVTTPSLPLDLAEGESAEFVLRVIPRTAGRKHFTAFITTDQSSTGIDLSTFAEVLPPCTLRVEPTATLLLRDALDGGLEGTVTFANEGAERCIVDNLRLGPATQFALVAGGRSQLELPPGAEHQVTIAGPKTAAGIAGAFGFHVFRANGEPEWIELRAP